MAALIVAGGMFTFGYFIPKPEKQEEIEYCTISFDTHGGNEIEDAIVEKGCFLSRPDDPTKEGFYFLDWYTSADYADVFNFEKTKIEEDSTLHAKWSESSEQFFEFQLESDGNSYSLKKYRGVQQNVTLPSQYNGINITSIQENAFKGNNTLKSVVIPNSVTYIGNGVFDGCRNLVSATLPNGITAIPSYLFNNCANLTTVNIPTSVTTIESYAFYNCSQLEDFDLSSCSALISISEYALTGIAHSEITFPNKELLLEENFIDSPLDLLVEVVNLTPEAGEIQSITNTQNTITITLLPTAEYDPIWHDGDDKIIQNGGNQYQIKTTTDTNINERYYLKANLTIKKILKVKFNIPMSERITEITFNSDGGTACENLTFYYGDEITLPTPRKGGYGFLGWYDEDQLITEETLANTYYREITLKAKWAAIFNYNQEYNPYNGGYYEITLTSLTDYGKTISQISSFPSFGGGIIQSKVIKFGTSLFNGATNLVSVVIPSTVTKVESNAFADCVNLERIILSGTDNISFDSNSFLNCPKFSAVYYNGLLSSYCKKGFSNNPLKQAHNLYINNELVTEVNITGVSSINSYTFDGCTSLTKVTMNNSVTAINVAAFRGCTNLKTIDISNNLQKIGYDVFKGCTSLEEIILPSSLTSISDTPFASCGKLKIKYLGTLNEWASKINFSDFGLGTSYDLYINDEIVSEANLTEIYRVNRNAFYGCSSLTKIDLSGNITMIDSKAFYNCTNLTDVIIGSSVAEIVSSAFGNCNSLSNVYYMGSPDGFNSINVGSSGNQKFTSANVYYYSQDIPSDSTHTYWHYDIDGKIILWQD